MKKDEQSSGVIGPLSRKEFETLVSEVTGCSLAAVQDAVFNLRCGGCGKMLSTNGNARVFPRLRGRARVVVFGKCCEGKVMQSPAVCHTDEVFAFFCARLVGVKSEALPVVRPIRQKDPFTRRPPADARWRWR